MTDHRAEIEAAIEQGKAYMAEMQEQVFMHYRPKIEEAMGRDRTEHAAELKWQMTQDLERAVKPIRDNIVKLACLLPQTYIISAGALLPLPHDSENLSALDGPV